MTNLLSLLPSARRYESTVVVEPSGWPGVRVTLRRMSLGRRIELARQVRELAARLEYLKASEQMTDMVESALLAAEIDATYLRWGVAVVEGLMIDGYRASVDDLISSAPEPLVRELVGLIKRECGLTEAERKN